MAGDVASSSLSRRQLWSSALSEAHVLLLLEIGKGKLLHTFASVKPRIVLTSALKVTVSGLLVARTPSR